MLGIAAAFALVMVGLVWMGGLPRKAQAPENRLTPVTDLLAVVTRQLTPYPKLGRLWRNVVIPTNLPRDQLIALARNLHNRHPSSSFRFFDDDTEFDQFMLWDLNYPNPLYLYPEKWTGKHYIAMLNPMLSIDGSGPRWTLVAMGGGMHLLPPDAQSDTIAVMD